MVYITFIASYSHEKWKEPRREASSLSLKIIEAKRSGGLVREGINTVRYAIRK